MTTSKLAALAALTLLASAAKAACTYPTAPTNIPDGNTATRDEMIAAKNEVGKYNEAITAYQNCLKLESDNSIAELDKQAAGKSDADKKALEEQKKEAERKLVEKNNAALDEVTAVVERFNEQLRAYNKKNPPAAKK
ncbi:MAG TPA: hypothetical protein VKB41_11525 [Steroidobacteraceae bacterium]|jgi:hypothetical protein|nr:hypothetical protein [Steroidobacteraceae bacterium]